MKSIKRLIAFVVVLCLSVVLSAREVALDSEALVISGARYVQQSADSIEFLRFEPESYKLSQTKLGYSPLKARSATGVVLRFATDSSKVELHFEFKGGQPRGGCFVVKQNSKYYKSFNFLVKHKDITLELDSVKSGEMVAYEIIMPLFWNPVLDSIVIDDGSKLGKAIPLPKKKYVALGDSITHGQGQKNSAQTYPWILATKGRMELYNLAVGGGKVSVLTAESLKDWKQIDLITVLVGYNGLHFAGKTVDGYRDDYNEMLDVIRKNHPKTKVVCISLLYTRKEVSEKTGLRAEQFREVVVDIVKQRQARGDKNIFLIKGDEVSSEKNLQDKEASAKASKKGVADPVHLGVEGAKLFAEALYQQMKKDGVVGHEKKSVKMKK